MSDFKPYWTRHPHQLRAYSLLCIALLPVILLISVLYATWAHRRELCGIVRVLFGDLWDGVTHTMPAKPIFRPLAGFVGWFMVLVVPQAAIVLVFNLYAGAAPLWAFFVLYAGIALYGTACRFHECKKARDKAAG